uniref:Uncharacterized protein n=2 Tax=Solanum tuberosum TaxID=4113 RepID=M1APJ2_SOLTU
MASEQVRRKDDNIIDEQHQIQIKKTRDPKRGSGTAAATSVKVQVGSDFHLAGPGAIHVTNDSDKHSFEERPGGVKFEVHSQRHKGNDNVKELASHGLGSTG